MGKPSVSILCITYNHQKYIAKCIESLINQQTNFEYVIIINDDCSQDKTSDICSEYEKKYPEKIIYSKNNKNLGMNANFVQTYNKCLETKSKYIAQIGGDDFWIDTKKLQKQYDILEANSEIVLCYSNSFYIIEEIESEKKAMIRTKPNPTIFNLEYLINHDFFTIPAHTIMFRSDAFPVPTPDFVFNSFNSDWALKLLIIDKGKAAYLDEFTAVYRKHSMGITSTSKEHEVLLDRLVLNKNLDKYFNYKYHHVFGKRLWHYKGLAIAYFRNKNYVKGSYWFLRCIFRNPVETFADSYFLKTLFVVLFYKQKK